MVLEEVKPAEDGRIRIQGEDQEFKRKEAQKRNEHEGGVLGEREASDPAHGKEGGDEEHSGRLEVLEENSGFDDGGIRVERGLKETVRPCVAMVLCERDPFWLGRMRRSNWSSV
jgi:hypothetical protein